MNPPNDKRSDFERDLLFIARPREFPSAKTIIQTIALAGGKTKGHERFMTKYQMIDLCRKWLALKGKAQ